MFRRGSLFRGWSSRTSRKDDWRPPTPPVAVRLAVGGEVEPAEITRVLGMEPSPPASGERATVGRGIPVEERWSRVIASAEAWEIDPLVEQAATALERVGASIGRLRAQHPKAWVGLVVVAYIGRPPHASSPGLALEPRLLGRLADLGIDVVVDYRLLMERVAEAD